MIKNQEIAGKIYYYAYVSPGQYNIYQMDRKIFGIHTNKVNRVIKSEKLVEREYLRIDCIQ